MNLERSAVGVDEGAKGALVTGLRGGDQGRLVEHAGGDLAHAR